MSTWYLGYCTQSPDGARIGRIVPLASLRKNAEGKLVEDSTDLSEEFGPSGFVFWPQSPPPSQDFGNAVVRFRCVPAPEHGDPNTARDWMRVQRSGNAWEVYRVGFRLVDQGPDLQWQQEPRWIGGSFEGEYLFVRDRAQSVIIGPWRVGRELPGRAGARELIPHPHANKVFSYPVRSLKPDSLFMEYVDAFGRDRPLECLLYPPEESTGSPVDLATPKQLAKWLIERVVSAAPQFVTQLDREVQGWRGRVREEIEGYGEAERQIFRSRWERIEAILDDLTFESDAANQLLQSPKFLARIDDLVKVAAEEKIAARSAEIEGEAQRSAKAAIAALEQQVAEVAKRYDEAKSKLGAVEADLQSRLDDLAERERAIVSLSEHLSDSRDRLARDLAVYQALLPASAQSPTSAAAPRRESPPVRPVGPPIQSESEFIDSRLWPALDRWHHGQPRSLAVTLQVAASGSRAVLVPSPAWARAYADALGGTARLTVVNVQPTWLGFDDLWRGGLACCWERATLDPTAIELVLLRDFNRALPQCYLRPILDLIAGYTEELPQPGCGGWPSTLRLFACPAESDESLPLTAEVVRHFAAVQRAPAAASERARPMGDGHVPAERWARWAELASTPDPDADLAREFGPLARSVASEIAAIAQNLRAVGMSEREARRTAHDVRVADPAGYLEEHMMQAGGSR